MSYADVEPCLLHNGLPELRGLLTQQLQALLQDCHHLAAGLAGLGFKVRLAGGRRCAEGGGEALLHHKQLHVRLILAQLQLVLPAGPSMHASRHTSLYLAHRA